MSTIPKGSTDNYSKHVKKIDDKGNLKSHPRMSANERTLAYERELRAKEGPVVPKAEDMARSPLPKMRPSEKVAGYVGTKLKAAKKYLVGETYDTEHAAYLKRRKKKGN